MSRYFRRATPNSKIHTVPGSPSSVQPLRALCGFVVLRDPSNSGWKSDMGLPVIEVTATTYSGETQRCKACTARAKQEPPVELNDWGIPYRPGEAETTTNDTAWTSTATWATPLTSVVAPASTPDSYYVSEATRRDILWLVALAADAANDDPSSPFWKQIDAAAARVQEAMGGDV